jgi:F0F1-type ATP synthase membrane subunit c/vacuolar-type H+-ATPase subunit K
MADVARIRYITEHYQNLQGLRLVPVGVACLALGMAQTAGVVEQMKQSAFLVGVAVSLAALGCSLMIGAWYERRFGSVEARDRTFDMTFFALSLLLVLAARLSPNPAPVWPAICAWGIGSLIRGCRQNGMLRHYLAIAAACFLLAALEVLGLSNIARDGSLQFVAGIAVLVAGVGDHAVLRSALNPPTREHDGSTV